MSYFDDPAISRSQLVDFKASRPLYYQRHVINDKAARVRTTSPMLLGTIGHLLALTPHLADQRIAIPPADVLTSNGQRRGKKYDEWKAAHRRFLIANEKEMATAMLAATSARTELARFVDNPGAVVEAEHWWSEMITLPDGSESEMRLRCKPDLYVCGPEHVVAIDLKFVSDLDGFERTIRGPGYYLQDAHYSAGLEAVENRPFVRFLFAATQTSYPFTTRVFELAPGNREDARDEWRELLEELAICQQTGDFTDRLAGQVQAVESTLFKD